VKRALAGATIALGLFLFEPLGALGLLAIFLLVSHLSHWRAGVASALVAASAPLYHVSAQGAPDALDVQSSIAIAVWGLGVACLGHGSRRVRLAAIAAGAAGLGLGWLAYGPLLAFGVPAATVTLTWALTHRRWAARAALLVAVTIAVACVVGIALAPSRDGGAPLALGARWLAGSTRASFDFALAELGHRLFPWSALLPFALAAMTEPCPQAAERESALRVLLLTGAVLSYGVSALSAWGPSPEPFAGMPFVAGAIGLWIWDIERGARVSTPVVLALVLLAGLFGLDFVRLPDKRVSIFTPAELADLAQSNTSLPALLWTSVVLTVGGALLGCVQDASGGAPRGQLPRVSLFVGTLLGAAALRLGR
jgi:hypothetical protein